MPRRDDGAVESSEEGEDARPKRKHRDNMRLGGSVFTGEVDRLADSIYEKEDLELYQDRTND